MLSKGEELLWVSKIMLGHSDVSTTLKCYAKYIPDEKKERAAFLENKRTNNVQVVSKEVESA